METNGSAYCKAATNLQAVDVMHFEDKMLNVDEDPVIYDLETMSRCLENLEDLVDYGMVNFLAFMNKKIPYFVNEKILDYVIVML